MCFSVNLECNIVDDASRYGIQICDVTSLVNTNNNMVITGYNNIHIPNKNSNNVKSMYIHGTNVNYIPQGLGVSFHLTVFKMYQTPLVEIKAINFNGMEDLKEIHVVDCGLRSLPQNVFSKLTKLNIISMNSNQIQELPSDLFINNYNLQEIHFHQNRIQYIGANLFNRLPNLNIVQLMENTCVNKFYELSAAINELKNTDFSNCKKPIELIISDLRKEYSEEINELKKNKLLAEQQNQAENNKLLEVQGQLTAAKADQEKDRTELNETKKSLEEVQGQLAAAKADQEKDQTELNETKKSLVEVQGQLTVAKADQEKDQIEKNETKKSLVEVQGQLATAKKNSDRLLDLNTALNNELQDVLNEKKTQDQINGFNLIALQRKLDNANNQLSYCSEKYPADL